MAMTPCFDGEPARVAPETTENGVDRMAEKPKLTGPAPGFVASPDHKVEVELSPKRVRLEVGGETIADSRAALVMLETRHEPIYYFPRADVRMDLMVRTDRETY